MRPRTVAGEVASQQCFMYLGIVPAEVSTPGLQPGDLKGQQGSEGEEPSQKLLSLFSIPHAHSLHFMPEESPGRGKKSQFSSNYQKTSISFTSGILITICEVF